MASESDEMEKEKNERESTRPSELAEMIKPSDEKFMDTEIDASWRHVSRFSSDRAAHCPRKRPIQRNSTTFPPIPFFSTFFHSCVEVGRFHSTQFRCRTALTSECWLDLTVHYEKKRFFFLALVFIFRGFCFHFVDKDFTLIFPNICSDKSRAIINLVFDHFIERITEAALDDDN